MLLDAFWTKGATSGVWTALELLTLSLVPMSLAICFPDPLSLSLINLRGKLKGSRSPLQLLRGCTFHPRSVPSVR